MAGPSDARQAISEGLAALQAGNPARVAALLRNAAASAGDDFPWMAPGNAELALGNLEAAETAIDRELKRDTRGVGALLLKGHLRQRLGDSRATSSFYQAAANQAAAGSPVPPEDREAIARIFQAIDSFGIN